MFEVILHEPEIPPNTGNIIRLCANSGCRLHLIEPLGFKLDDARLRRAGLDYHEYAGVLVHPDLATCLTSLKTSLDTQELQERPRWTPKANTWLDTHEMESLQGLDTQESRATNADQNVDVPDSRKVDVQGSPQVFAFSTRGTRRHDQISWRVGDAMLFGAETRGLPEDLLAAVPESQRVRLPMRPHNRSLNLSNAVAVAVFEAWRQLDFSGGT